MLRKLIKYDFLWMNRTLIIFFILTIIFAILTRVSYGLTDSAIGSLMRHILPACTIAAMVNTIINAAIRVWARFRQNFYKDEAYLAHTLPVTKGQLYDSKIISGLLVTLCSAAVVIGCFFIAFWDDDMYQYFHNLITYKDMGFILGGVIVTAVLEVIYIVAVGIFGIVVGHRSNNNRTVYSAIIGIGLYFALQMALLAAIYVAGFFDDSIKAMFSNNPDNSLSFSSYRSLVLITDIIYAILNIGLFLGARTIFKRGVNVE